ncbi:IS30 family transposase [Pleionea sp. CnH1-48]|uniref:IS30 family transposase n=1 Tax=Pleionea sp. CnH1-48 TaxID=2954494 RepID=UPI0020973E91|nr:IS30 family transposase [Pleionea sp. CnH1-48]MCO7223530.1 IS30 family transposase [Pleionea sp. CnH1-48]
MGKIYSHLSLFERQRIFDWFHYQKKSIREIARRLSRSHSTISREIKRHTYFYYVDCYYPHPAHQAYKSMLKNRAKKILTKCDKTQNYVIEKLKLGWSPGIISGRLKRENELRYICHESIYQFIYKEAPELRAFLPRKHKRRRKKYPYRKHPTKISLKTSILECSPSINNRSEFGHWESDSIESKNRKCAINVLLERVSRLTHITKLTSKKAFVTKNAIVKRLSEHPGHLVKSITYDNGVENAEHLEVNRRLNCDSYFCQPYHSWEKGAVEQINSLIRRFLPKGTDFTEVTDTALRKIEYQLNSRPRKCLDYRTPNEVYNEINGALST